MMVCRAVAANTLGRYESKKKTTGRTPCKTSEGYTRQARRNRKAAMSKWQADAHQAKKKQ